MKYYTATLSNGLRIIHRPSHGQVVYCGYQIAAGARNEAPGEEGLAHFCEHVAFKGTKHRRAWQIINCLESVGGELNAYTNKEDTTYYAAIPKEHTARAIDLLTDIVFHSIYPASEVQKEVEVICDEIESYNDSSAELIYDEFESIIFKGKSLGHNILGTADNVRSFTTADALRFTRKYYRSDNAIFFIYGDVDFNKVIKKLNRATTSLSPSEGGDARLRTSASETVSASHDASETHLLSEGFGEAEREAVTNALGDTVISAMGTHQSHVMLGTRAYNIHDKRRITLYLLNNMLGGPGMNARLNVVLREHHGLVYTVESTMVSYADTGMWCTYFGCDPHDVKRCLRLVRKELDRFMRKPISETRLRMAKKQLKGQIGIACDNRENFALDFGKSFLHYGWEKDVTALYTCIDEVTAESILDVANDLFSPHRLTTLIYQ